MTARRLAAVGLVLAAVPAGAQVPRVPGPPLAAPRPAADSLCPPPRPADDWVGRDKVLHAAGSLLLTLSAQYVLTDKLDLSNARALPVAAGATLALGVLKEVADSRRPVGPLFSWRDLAADAAGVALGALVAAW